MASKGALGGVLGGFKEALFGGNTDEEDARSREYMEQALAEFDKLRAPDLQPIDLEEHKYLGEFNPYIDLSAGADVAYDPSQAISADPSAFERIELDPRLRNEQIASLDALRDIYEGGGLTAADQANLSRIRNETSQADRGRREAIRQNMAQRGMSGSGMDLLTQLQSSQAATDRAAQEGLDIAGMAQDRALQALMQGGQMAGSIRGQDFDEQSQVAAAKDIINRFNAQNLTQNNQFNTGNLLKTNMYNKDMAYDAAKTKAGMQFDAQKQSWDARQNIANANVDTRNKATMHNQFTLPQTKFDNEYRKTAGKSGAAQMGSQYWQSVADREAREADEMFKTVVRGGVAAYTGGA